MYKRLIILMVLLLSTFSVFAGGQSLLGHKLPAYFKTTTGLNIRQSPEIKGKKIKTLPKNTEVYVIQLSNNGFCQVKYCDIVAYVSTDYLTFSREVEVKNHELFEGGIVRQGDGVKEFLWNLSVICNQWLFDLIGNWCMLVGGVLLLLGWLLLVVFSEDSEKVTDSLYQICFLAVLPAIVAFKDFAFYDDNNILGWIGAGAMILSFVLLVLNSISGGLKGLLIGLLVFMLLYFGLVFLSVLVKFVLCVLLLISAFIGDGGRRLSSNRSYSSGSSGYSYSSSSYSSSDERSDRNGTDMLFGLWGDGDKGKYVDNDTFKTNDGETYYRHPDGEWHTWDHSD